MVFEFIENFIVSNPKIGVIAIAVFISLIVTLANYFLMDKKRMKEIKERQKELQAELKKHKGNTDKEKEIGQELMSHAAEMLKHSFKPMLITILPIILIFGWMRKLLVDTSIAGTWFWWYLIGAIVSGMIFRKVFKLP
ncbi:DUF106 domain-containing protein [Candidatus Pacearchaeota archaeon]|nr:DUF106 domain-containing protein [Candidatus Pacearchaeota archaeon]